MKEPVSKETERLPAVVTRDAYSSKVDLAIIAGVSAGGNVARLNRRSPDAPDPTFIVAWAPKLAAALVEVICELPVKTASDAAIGIRTHMPSAIAFRNDLGIPIL